MKNINIGIVKLIISDKLKNSYFNENLIKESKNMTSEFVDIIKNSPILNLQLKVFENIENKYIDNELTAARYIDNNIKLFEIYSIDEINKEKEKLSKFIIDENINIANDKLTLYNSIDNLITESLNDYDKIDVDDIHESFTNVLNHIRQPKIKIESVPTNEIINEEIIEIAINKFNERYNTLNEDDKKLIQSLIKSNDSEKKNIFETYKNETLTILEKIDINEENVKEKAEKIVQKIKNMKYDKSNVDNDIISLHELKRDLI